MKIIIKVSGRRKDTKISTVVDKTNDAMQKMGLFDNNMKIMVNQPIHEVTIHVPKAEWEEKSKETLDGMKKIYSESFEDVTFDSIQKIEEEGD